MAGKINEIVRPECQRRSGSVWAIGLVDDFSLLVQLHNQAPCAGLFHDLLRQGFPDNLNWRPESRRAGQARLALRRFLAENEVEPDFVRRQVMDYQTIYLTPGGVDGAGRVMRRGDDFVGSLNVLRGLIADMLRPQLASLTHRSRDSRRKGVLDYLDLILPERLIPFLTWAERRNENGFYGVLAVLTLSYCHDLQSRLQGICPWVDFSPPSVSPSASDAASLAAVPALEKACGHRVKLNQEHVAGDA